MPISEEPTAASASTSPFPDILTIPDETLKNIDYFNNRYLGYVLKTVYALHPEIRDEIERELEKAVSNKKHDKVQRLIEDAGFPLYPNHYKLDDFNSTCLSDEDKKQLDDLKTLAFITSDCPNITIKGPQHFGSEKLASGLGDALCSKLYSVQYIKFNHLLSLLSTHSMNSKSNSEYEKLQKKDCLIIEDFAGEAIVDRDLLSVLYTFLDTRITSHRNAFSYSRSKGSPSFKPSATIITTCRDYREWGSFFDSDINKAASLISLFYGYGCIINVDEAKEEEKPTTESK